MAVVDPDAVHGEDARHLLNDGRARGLDSVRAQDRADIVRVDLVQVHDAVAKVPACTEVDSLGDGDALWREAGGQLELFNMRRTGTNVGGGVLVRGLADEAACDARDLVHDGVAAHALDDADE